MKDHFTMIRKYTNTDETAVVNAWYKANRLAHPFLSLDFLEDQRTAMKEMYLPNAETWVIEVDQKVVGFIALIGSEIGGLFVDPEFHGQKLGFALVNKAVAEKGSLTVEVFKQNPIGRKFYNRYGFCDPVESFHEMTGQQILTLNYTVS